MKIALPALAGALALLVSSAAARADAIAVGSGWQDFDVDPLIALSSGTEWIALDGSALSFDVTLSSAAVLTVVDAGFAGDRFEVFDNGVALGLTSLAAGSYPASIGLDFDAALAGGAYSRASFVLGAGTHSITGRLFASALDAGGAPIDATVGAVMLAPMPVPEPSTWALMGAGLAAAGLAARRRRAWAHD